MERYSKKGFESVVRAPFALITSHSFINYTISDMTIYKFLQNQIMSLYQGSHHLADEPRDEQQCQDAVIIASVFQEGLRHEGDQQ